MPRSEISGPRTLPVLAVLLALSTAVADTDFPANAAGPSRIDIQRKVYGLFEDGQYERALIIYRKELAPTGDKFAQYMVGYMHLAGKGVDKDMPAAAAWFRLAAERREERFMRATENLYAELPLTQRLRADELFLELRRELGDANLLMSFLDEDIAALRARLRSPSLAQSAVDNTGNGSVSELAVVRLESRIMARLNYVEGALRADPLASDEDMERFRELQRRGERLVRESRRSR